MTRVERPWTVWLAIPVVIVALLMGVLGYALAGSLRDALTTAPLHRAGFAGVAAQGAPPALTVTSTFLQDLALALAVLAAAWFASAGRLTGEMLGLRRARIGSSTGFVIAGYVAFLIVSAIWTSALSITDRENIAVDLGTRDSALALIGAGLLVGVAAPIAEELFFRGFVFGALRRYGFPVAAGVTGLAFGGAHVASAPVGFLLPLALLGVILCALYERTGSLYPGIALHCLNNAVAFGAGDGRGWIVPATLVGSGAAIVVVMRGLERLLDRPHGGGRLFARAATQPG